MTFTKPSDFSCMTVLQAHALEARTNPTNPDLLLFTSEISDRTDIVREGVEALISKRQGQPAKSVWEILNSKLSRAPYAEYGFAGLDPNLGYLSRIIVNEAKRNLRFWLVNQPLGELFCSKCATSRHSTEFTQSIFRCDRHET